VGQPHAMMWRSVGRCREVEEAEALALLEGIHLVQQWPPSTPVIFESDCANLVQKTENRGLDRSVISTVMRDIKHGLTVRGNSSVHKIWREQNTIALNLAKFALKSHTSQVSSVIVPPCIRDLVFCDRDGVRGPVILLNKGGFFVGKNRPKFRRGVCPWNKFWCYYKSSIDSKFPL
jgi:hypothetical protein